MSFESPDKLQYGGRVWSTHAYPLQQYLEQTGNKPFSRIWPNLSRGYFATWHIDAGKLWLTSLKPDSEQRLLRLFHGQQTPIMASWYSGYLHGFDFDGRRVTGCPPRRFYDEQVILLIEQGEIMHEWVVDLRHVPDQTDDEIRQSYPAFLWPERLRGAQT